MNKFINPKIAIVHDSLRFFGGAERVLYALHRVYPNAHIYTSVISWEDMGSFTEKVQKMNITTSWAQKIFLFRKYPFLFRYLLLFIWRSFDLTGYDIIISSSGAQMSHLVQKRPDALHICYCYTPPRHLYGYLTDFSWNRIWLVKKFSEIGNFFLRRINEKSIKQIDFFVACSYEVANRIKRLYKRPALVIYPPVGLSRQKIETRKKGLYYLSVSRLSRMKHVDIIIRAANEFKIQLHIVGTGPEEKYLKCIAGNTVSFLGQVNDEQLAKEYTGCKALICAAEDEDFGITPLEAMSFGKPVIAYYSGGYKETVIDGKTGVFFNKLTPESIIGAIKKLGKNPMSSKDCKMQAKKFSQKNFNKQMREVVDQVMKV